MSRKAKKAARRRQRRPSRKSAPGNTGQAEQGLSKVSPCGEIQPSAVIPAKTVIPAKAGIHISGYKERDLGKALQPETPVSWPRTTIPSAQPAQTAIPDRKIVISQDGPRLTPRQQAVLPVLALSHSIAQAARDTGVSERTIYRWLNDAEFREQLSQLQEASYDLSRRQLQALAPHFLSVIAREAIENPDPALRVRAARYGMDYAVKFCDVDRLGDALRGLQDTLRNAR